MDHVPLMQIGCNQLHIGGHARMQIDQLICQGQHRQNQQPTEVNCDMT